MDLLARLKGAGEGQVASEIRAKLQTLAFDEVGATLSGWLRAYPSRFTALCERASRDSVSIADWADLHADITEADRQRLSPVRQGCAAAGLLLKNDNNADDPCLEVRIYGFDLVPQPNAGRERLLQVIDSGPPNWLQHGLSGSRLFVRGLEELTAALRSCRTYAVGMGHWDNAGNEAIGAFAANWLQVLRVHQALVSHVEEGLPFALPVFVGMDRTAQPMEVGINEFGPNFETVYLTHQNPRTALEAERVIAERGHQLDLSRTQEIDDAINEVREWRGVLESLPASAIQAREAYQISCEVSEMLLRHLAGLAEGPPMWRMSDAEFEAFAAQVSAKVRAR